MGILYLEEQSSWPEVQTAIDTVYDFFPNEEFRGARNFLEFIDILSDWEERSVEPSLFLLDVMIASELNLNVLNLGYTVETASGFNAGLLLASKYLRGKEIHRYGDIPIVFISSRKNVDGNDNIDPIYAELYSNNPDNTFWLVKGKEDSTSSKLLEILQMLFQEGVE